MMLFDAIDLSVCYVSESVGIYIQYVRKNGQRLCFVSLHRLVARWSQRLESEKHAHAKAGLKQ